MIAVGSRLGPYEILSALGAGGMGEVYRARDSKLNRDVALKVLPEAFTLDPDRLARFKREAQVLASLNHPNIAAIYGFEESDGVQALVLELVDGPTLADRIAQGPIPLDEALPIARQIAEALEAAHEQGIVHRDLKPANIKMRPDGTVKVLDFGLAKALEPAAATGVDVTASPTITSPAMTRMGVILGTAAYMSPEQAKGRAADKRSDVWAFGGVLYEMLTGTRAFDGEDVSDTLASVLAREPNLNALPANVPPSIRTLIKRCLEKDRRQRIADISTALFVIDEQTSMGPAEPIAAAQPASVPRRPMWRRALPWAVGIGVSSLLTGTGVWFATRPATSAPRVVRFTITPSGTAALTAIVTDRNIAISPDGSHLVYVGNNGTQLFVRGLEQLEPTPIAGLGAPRGPFLAPDGQWIGFFDAMGAVKKVAITGGPALTVCRITGIRQGATWAEDGTIIFATDDASTGLQRVSAAGGEPTVLTKPNREHGEADHLCMANC